MDSDTQLEIVINVGYTVQVLKTNGSSISGWPKTLSYPGEGAPAFGDIDGDGQGEIVVTGHGLTSDGYIYAFKKNGTTCSGFPINHGYSSRTPVLADIDFDGKMEIIVNKRLYPLGEEWIYRGTGVVYPGWPKPLNHVPASSAAVGDINNDGFPEIIAESYNSLYAWTRNGDSIPGFPFTMPNGDVNSYSSPVLADVDGDNNREIIFGTHVLGGGGYVYVLKNNGTILPGWPKYANYWIYGPPAVGFINGDNILDIAVGDQVMSMTPVDRVYAWNKNGTSLTGFPIVNLNAVNTQIVIADIDNDNYNEIIFDDNTQTTSDTSGQYFAYNHNGTLCAGWPLRLKGTSFFTTPALLDINRDNILEMVGAGMTGSGSSTFENVYLWSMGVPYNPAKITIPMWQYNTRHNGVYGDISLTEITNIHTEIPNNFTLYQNYPNPFNPTTKIKFIIPTLYKGGQGGVSLKIYNVLGSEIITLVNEQLSPGTYEVTFDGSNFSSGIYFYQLKAGEFFQSKKLILLK
jgi:hypothetical protein